MLSFIYSKKNGHADVVRTGSTVNYDSISGAAAPYLSQAQIDDNMLHRIGNEMGRPTDRFPDDTHVSTYQKGPPGARFYNNHLWKQNTALAETQPAAISTSGDVVDKKVSKSDESHNNKLSQLSQPELKKKWSARVAKKVMRAPKDAVSLRRNGRILQSMSKKESDGNITHTIVDSFFEVSNGQPSPGMSVECFEQLKAFTKTPEESNMNKCEQKLSDIDENSTDNDSD